MNERGVKKENKECSGKMFGHCIVYDLSSLESELNCTKTELGSLKF
jgi:hypothetical protein